MLPPPTASSYKFFFAIKINGSMYVSLLDRSGANALVDSKEYKFAEIGGNFLRVKIATVLETSGKRGRMCLVQLSRLGFHSFSPSSSCHQ